MSDWGAPYVPKMPKAIQEYRESNVTQAHDIEPGDCLVIDGVAYGVRDARPLHILEWHRQGLTIIEPNRDSVVILHFEVFDLDGDGATRFVFRAAYEPVVVNQHRHVETGR